MRMREILFLGQTRSRVLESNLRMKSEIIFMFNLTRQYNILRSAMV